eukprot:scaffold2747_cov51-Attheya_sp.AAC.4
MASSAALMMRSVAQRSVGQALRLNTTSKIGSARFASSYFTPGTPSLLAMRPHEYVKVDGKVGTCGITDFAQAALGDIVFVDLPEVGDEFEKGDSFGSVESVKAASDVYCPVSGTVVAVNEALSDEPGLVNTAAETDAWFIKLELTEEGETDDLMEADAYKAHCDSEAH